MTNSAFLDDLMRQFADMVPIVHIGRGPEYPTSPRSDLGKQTERWLQLHPFLQKDLGYVDFLLRYSGAEASNPETGFDVYIAGFTGFGGILNEVAPCVYDDTFTGIDENEFYPFAAAGVGQEAIDFSFDASGCRRWGVYQRSARPLHLHGPEQWYCSTFLDWLVQVVQCARTAEWPLKPSGYTPDVSKPSPPG